MSIELILLEQLELWSPTATKLVPLKSNIPSRNCGDFGHRPQPFQCNALILNVCHLIQNLILNNLYWNQVVHLDVDISVLNVLNQTFLEVNGS